jgi:hypothetical protein
VQELNGTVPFKRADAAQLKVTALDFNGCPAGSAGLAKEIKHQPTTIYDVIARQQSCPRLFKRKPVEHRLRGGWNSDLVVEVCVVECGCCDNIRPTANTQIRSGLKREWKR